MMDDIPAKLCEKKAFPSSWLPFSSRNVSSRSLELRLKECECDQEDGSVGRNIKAGIYVLEREIFNPDKTW